MKSRDYALRPLDAVGRQAPSAEARLVSAPGTRVVVKGSSGQHATRGKSATFRALRADFLPWHHC